jgi:hypothetical protein
MTNLRKNFRGKYQKNMKRQVVLEDNTYTLEAYCKKLLIHPRTLMRKITGLENPPYGHADRQIAHVEDVARALGCKKWKLMKIMQSKDHAWTPAQACKTLSISSSSLKNYKYPRFINQHKLVRYSRNDLTNAHFKHVEI